MNPLQKNIALWLVISLVFVLLYHLFSQPKGAQENIVYTDFLTYVNKGVVKEVTIQGENISGKLTDGKTFKTFMPRDTDIVKTLIAKDVRIFCQAGGRFSMVYDHSHFLVSHAAAYRRLDFLYATDAERRRQGHGLRKKPGSPDDGQSDKSHLS